MNPKEKNVFLPRIRPRFMLKKYSSYIVFLILLWILAISLIVSYQESTTMDEQAHIPAAYTYVKYHDMRLNPEHPPLLKDLAGLPLLFLKVNFPTETKEWQEGINEQWTLGNKFLHYSGNDADAITFYSRIPIILVTLLLGVFIFQWTRELAGTMAALFALILYSFNPNILGHSHYVTTDIGIAAFIFIAFYFFIKFLKQPDWKNTLLAGIFLGLAQLTKFSAVLLFPYFGLLLIVYALFKRKPESITGSILVYKLKKMAELGAKYAIIIVVCFILIWVLYLYNTFNMPSEKIQDITKMVLGDEGLGKPAKEFVLILSQNFWLKGLSEYFLGVFMVFSRVAGGNTYYFLGEVNNQATPWYFPAVFVMKETIIFLFLILFSIFYSLWGGIKKIRSQEGLAWKKVGKNLLDFMHTGVVQYSMLGFIFLYSYLSITGNLNIGFRHLFPILPFAYVLVSQKLFDFLSSVKKERFRWLFNKIVIVFAVLIILEPIAYYPSYLSYFNRLFGGPQEGYQYVTDSNYDWGQDLKRLRNWVANYNHCAETRCNPNLKDGCPSKCYSIARPFPTPAKTIDKIRVDYFGGSNPEYYLSEKFVPWHSHKEPEPGWYAISAVFRQEGIYKKKAPGETGYEWLLKHKPVARAGDSIFIYHIK